jgi:peptidylprolyl isomerase
MRYIFYILLIFCITPTYGEQKMNTETKHSNEVILDSGLKYIDIVEGTGASPKPGNIVCVHYTGTLENGKKFDSSEDRGQPFRFPIGQGVVIKGWDEGVMTMKVGGERKLIIPANLGYGTQEIPGVIPANSTLIFTVKLLSID